MYSCDAKLYFQHHHSRLLSMSHDPSEVILRCWFAETFLVIIDVKNGSYSLHNFLKPCYIFSRIFWWIESSKEQHFFKIELFCKIINVFSVTFHQFNVSLLNKSINFLKKKNLTDPKLMYTVYCPHIKKIVCEVFCVVVTWPYLVASAVYL